jgi:CSLREA domain-containing protein
MLKKYARLQIRKFIIKRTKELMHSAVVLSLIFTAFFANSQRSVAETEPVSSDSAQIEQPSINNAADPQAPESTVLVFGNTTPIMINDNSTASPYPSTITVSGVDTTALTKITATLIDVTHTFPDDVDILLVGPQGQRAMLMSDAGGGTDAISQTIRFDPDAANSIPDGGPLVGGIFQGSNYVSAPDDNFPTVTPPVSTTEPADLSVFANTDPNGDWKLYVVDDAGQDSGAISGGWQLRITVPLVTVNSTADPGDGTCDQTECTLREAIDSVADGGTINFSPLFNNPQTITLNGTELLIDKSLTISGPGADKLTISGDNASRVFRIVANVNAAISGMTVSNGSVTTNDSGGGIDNSGTLTLINLTVSNNSGGIGGGIGNGNGTLTLINSAVSNNSAREGAGIGNLFGTVTITNSTISNNSASVVGGGIMTFGNSSTVTIINSTVSNNSASTSGGGIRSFSNLQIISRNSIIANNTAPTGPDIVGTLNSQGYNLIENTSNTTITGDMTGNITGVDPMLAPLGNYGGPTETHALLPGSPAIDKGSSPAINTDQRGFTRPVDVPGIPPAIGDDSSDIGAFETQVGVVANTNDSGAGSLRDAINNSPPGSYIFLDSSLGGSPQTITLTSGEIVINRNLTITGPGASLLTISGNNQSRVFNISSGFNVTLSGMTISNGSAGDGGGIQNSGTVTITNSIISNNSANLGGGGIFSNGTLTLTNSTVSNNSGGDFGGGGIKNFGGTATITNSTISGNVAEVNGGGVYSENSIAVSLTNSTVSGNLAQNSGGGIYNIVGGPLTLTNSTVSGNSAQGSSAGGIYNDDSTATLTNSTISNNSGSVFGGGIRNRDGTLNSRNTIIADNTAEFGPDFHGTITSQGYNLIENTSNTTITGDTTGNQLNIDPLLAPLGDYGGSTQTHALLPGSPVIDKGSSSGSSTDQREAVRPFDDTGIPNTDDGSDIGAFERQPGDFSGNSAPFDFDGDGKSDVSIFRPGPTPAQWWILRSSDLGNNAYSFGLGSDKPVPADFTGDGKTDLAFFRESSSEWFVLRSEDSTFFSFPFGASGDIPAPGDFDGDGIADAAVYRPSSGTWFILNSTGGTRIEGFGISEDKPVVGDYDGEGMDDIAIFRPSVAQWWLNRSTDGVLVYQFGASGDKTVQGDHTGDGKADAAFWRPSTGEWFVIRSEDQTFYSFPFGTNGDVPVTGDYDGDGAFDAAVFRPASNTWFINGSTSGVQILGFGAAGDIPLANAYSVP